MEITVAYLKDEKAKLEKATAQMRMQLAAQVGAIAQIDALLKKAEEPEAKPAEKASDAVEKS